MNAVAQIYGERLSAATQALSSARAAAVDPADTFRAIYADRVGVLLQSANTSGGSSSINNDAASLISGLARSGASGADMLNALGVLAFSRLGEMLKGGGAESSEADTAQDVEAVDAIDDEQDISPLLKLKTTEYDELIQQASNDYSIPAYLIKGVIATESSFRKDAVSRVGAEGLMQLMPGTARMLGVTDSFDPAQNIDAGTRYLSQLLDRYEGDPRLALAAYNCGPSRVSEMIAGAQGDPYDSVAASVRGYVGKVIDSARSYAI